MVSSMCYKVTRKKKGGGACECFSLRKLSPKWKGSAFIIDITNNTEATSKVSKGSYRGKGAKDCSDWVLRAWRSISPCCQFGFLGSRIFNSWRPPGRLKTSLSSKFPLARNECGKEFARELLT